MKLLVTGGCSFSETSRWVTTWPTHLEQHLVDCKHISTALSGQGNGLISRRIIYQVTEALKHYDANHILVGVMWSGPGRHDFYSEHIPPLTQMAEYDNPTVFVEGAEPHWIIVNRNCKSHVSQTHYRLYHDTIGQYIYTNEHILRTQWFLKSNNIKYFMSTYTSDTFQENNHIDIKHLYEQIDFNCFLPVNGEYEWCRDESGLEFPIVGDRHPGTEQHKSFTEQVIVPFLQQRNFI